MFRDSMKARLLPLLVAAIVLLQPCHARADLLNGSFSQGSDGLLNWQITDGAGNPLTGQVSVSGGVATILEPLTSEIDLFQVFTIGSNVVSLSFTFNSAFSDSTNPLPSGATPDAFGVSLLDPNTGLALLTPVAGSDSFYTNDIVPGITSATPDTGTGSTVTVTGGPFPNTVTVSGLSAFDGQSAVILFRFIGGSTSEHSTVSISDVVENTSSNGGGGGPAAPEPASLILFGLGSLGLGAYRWSKRERTGPSLSGW